MTATLGRNLWSELGRSLDLAIGVRFGLAVLAAVLAACLTALSPVMLKQIIDLLGAGGAGGPLLAAGAGYIAVVAFGRMAAGIQIYIYGTGSQALEARVDTAIFGQLLRLPLRRHMNEGPGSFRQIHGHALQGVRLVTSIVCFTLLPVIIQMTIILIVVAGLANPGVWLVIASAIVGYTCVFALGVQRIAAPTSAALDLQTRAGQWFSDALVNAETIKGLNAEDQIQDRYGRHVRASERQWRRCYARRTETLLLSAVIFVATLAAITWLATGAIGSGQMSVGGFIMLHAYALQLVGPLETTGTAIRDLSAGLTYLDGWRRLLGRSEQNMAPGEGQPSRKANEMTPGQEPSVQFSGVSFGYEPGRCILTNVSFSVRRHQTLAIVGESGSGKSSILKLLQGHYVPDEGSVLIDGERLGELEPGHLTRQIGVVSQDVVLFNETLRFNLLVANPTCSEAALSEALSAARLTRLVAQMPDGLETQVGERGLKLSGGEKQRVALARVLLRNPEILLLDEPTSALDAGTEREICIDLLKASAGRTSLIVTHRLVLASLAQSIVVLQEGRIVEQGSHRDLVTAGGRYAALWRQQQSVEIIGSGATTPTGLADAGQG